MKKICFVCQRYGLEVNGGAELLCRQLAEHLLVKYKDIHVVTTRAVDYMTWADVYSRDCEEINGVKVHRFSVDYEREQNDFNTINAEFLAGRLPVSREREWIDRQGPVSSALINYIKEHKDVFDVFIFNTYLYYPTVLGVKEVADKAIVIPDAHDEPFLKMKIFEDVFLAPRAFFFNTEEERRLVHSVFHNEKIPSLIGGVGVDIPELVSGASFKKKYGLNNYIVYVGRIDEGKNCNILFEDFINYKCNNANNLKLVLIGKPVIEIPNHSDIISIGFVSDQDKFDGIAGAKALILPSEYESLSIVTLEAMSIGTPVIVNGKCPVLKGHCIKSNGAFYYNSFRELESEINFILKNKSIVNTMCENAKQYVCENYQWNVITDKLSQLIESI